jgi:predicted secreted hydrolase
MSRILSLLFLLLLPTLSHGEYLKVQPGRALSFPQDHGSHDDYPTEWWYFTGHLKSKTQTYGFELTFFRVGIQRASGESEWHTNNLYVAHFAVTDDKKKRLLFDERSSRSVFNQAGAKLDNLDVWNGDWSAVLNNGVISLEASGKDQDTGESFKVKLNLEPEKPLVLHGENGFSQKGPDFGQASYYTSYTRLLGKGVVSFGSKTAENVSASAWMDHEVVSFAASSGKLGWDWFAIQLDDGRDLMVYHLRKENGDLSEYSKGTLVERNGEIRRLNIEDYKIEATSHWVSPNTGVRYPIGWRVLVPEHKLDLEIVPTVLNQEIRSSKSTGVNYWEGRCLVKGRSNGTSGQAYVELAGYKKNENKSK